VSSFQLKFTGEGQLSSEENAVDPLNPRPSLPDEQRVSFVEPEVEPSTMERFLYGAGVALTVIAARWRGVILLFLLLLALWFAVQVVLAVRSAISYVRDNIPKNWSELHQEFPAIHVPRLGSPRISLPITSCWRDRSVAAGDCFRPGGTARPSPPVRRRAPEPCPVRIRFQTCRPVDI
jgi:hypothetical protein